MQYFDEQRREDLKEKNDRDRAEAKNRALGVIAHALAKGIVNEHNIILLEKKVDRETHALLAQMATQHTEALHERLAAISQGDKQARQLPRPLPVKA